MVAVGVEAQLGEAAAHHGAKAALVDHQPSPERVVRLLTQETRDEREREREREARTSSEMPTEICEMAETPELQKLCTNIRKYQRSERSALLRAVTGAMQRIFEKPAAFFLLIPTAIGRA